MVCNRCVSVVKQEFGKRAIDVVQIGLGYVEVLDDAITDEQFESIDTSLSELGFERINDRKARLIESIKNYIIQLIHNTEEQSRKFNWSTILAEKLNYEYNYLSNLFSSVEGITLEQYIIKQKIEKVKELLFYDELSLGEIADRMGYSSIAHLSGQFKKITGFTPSQLKKSRSLDQNRKPLDHIH